MRKFLITMVACAAGTTAAVAQAAPAAPSADMKMTAAQCEALWKQALGSDTGDLAMDKAKPYAEDFKKVDMNADGKLQSTEWMDGCNKGFIKSASTQPNSGSSSGASSGTSGSSATSDRTPGAERTPGAGNTGAAGTDAGKTPSGTSDRTPSK